MPGGRSLISVAMIAPAAKADAQQILMPEGVVEAVRQSRICFRDLLKAVQRSVQGVRNVAKEV